MNSGCKNITLVALVIFITQIRCCNTVKMRETPKAFSTTHGEKSTMWNPRETWSYGHGKNLKDITMGNPQPSS